MLAHTVTDRKKDCLEETGQDYTRNLPLHKSIIGEMTEDEKTN